MVMGSVTYLTIINKIKMYMYVYNNIYYIIQIAKFTFNRNLICILNFKGFFIKKIF